MEPKSMKRHHDFYGLTVETEEFFRNLKDVVFFCFNLQGLTSLFYVCIQFIPLFCDLNFTSFYLPIANVSTSLFQNYQILTSSKSKSIKWITFPNSKFWQKESDGADLDQCLFLTESRFTSCNTNDESMSRPVWDSYKISKQKSQASKFPQEYKMCVQWLNVSYK